MFIVAEAAGENPIALALRGWLYCGFMGDDYPNKDKDLAIEYSQRSVQIGPCSKALNSLFWMLKDKQMCVDAMELGDFAGAMNVGRLNLHKLKLVEAMEYFAIAAKSPEFPHASKQSRSLGKGSV